jgi:hypothetical protein
MVCRPPEGDDEPERRAVGGHEEEEGFLMDTILRCLDFAFDFIWMVSPVVILGLCAWRLAR